jgi:hypothetical protein
MGARPRTFNLDDASAQISHAKSSILLLASSRRKVRTPKDTPVKAGGNYPDLQK